MPQIQNFITVTNAPTLEYLAQDYATPGPAVAPDEVVSDSVDFSIQPVIENAPGSDPIYSPDFETTDTLSMAIGNFDQPPTGGVYSLQIGAVSDAGLLGLAYNTTAAALQTALNVALTAEGGGTPLCAVTLITAGVYLIVGATNGAIASGLFHVTNYATLFPTSTAFFQEGTLGTSTTPYRLTLTLVQSPMCYAEPTTDLDPADVAITTVQAGGATANKIQNIQFSADAYAGSATITADAGGTVATCGTILLGMSASAIGNVLRNHPEINYAEPDGTASNVVVTQIGDGWNVEFTGTLGNDNANALSSSNNSVTGPQGKSGTIIYNTFELWMYSQTQTGDSFQLTRQIQRTRVSGEVRTIYSAPVTIKKSMINPLTAVPVPLAGYYTKVESDARYLRRDASSHLLTGGTLTVDSGATLALNGALSGTTTGGTLDGTNTDFLLGNTQLPPGKSLTVHTDSNAYASTFTLVAGVASVGNTVVTINSVIIVTLRVLGGTQSNWLKITPDAGVGFDVVGENAADTSTYNYIMFLID